ncbi:MAG: hypothetical protein CFE45_04285 [Burkholderiales bacterium PBB5]|nr:MAG: hypothetical protein CFE45_04285 [Burkholderiales bacterium PBB5]
MIQHFMAVYTGSPDAMQRAGWDQLSPEVQQQRMAAGIQAWHAWVKAHQADIVDLGGPLGTTKRVSAQGVADVRNALSGYTIVRAESHEAAARLFEQHPHFTHFPGDAVEIMAVLPVPGL